jgi:hypothetical protein
MATTYLTRAANTSNTTKATYSFWVKKSKLADTQIIHNFYSAGSTYNKLYFDGNDQIILKQQISGSTQIQIMPSMKFRDVSGWYNIVYSIDTTQGTEADRVKVYVNGVQQTSLGTATYPSVNANVAIGYTQYIGREETGDTKFFNGSLSHFNFVDGTAYPASTFGSTDSTTGEWKINTSPSVTYGTNGFFILKNGNSLTDESGNSNNFTLGGGTLTKTEDCPSNNFPTWNPAFMPFNIGNGRADNGGTTIGSPGGDSSSLASMGARSGKYYWEIRVQNAVNTRSCGVVRSDLQGQSSTSAIYPGGNGNASNFTSAYNMVNGFVQTVTGGTQAQQGSLATLTTGDFLGVALDIDNLDIKWYKNDSLVTTTSLTSAWIENGLFIMPCNRLDGNQFVEYNFGNGCFGSTQLTGTTYPGEGGLGIFKYEPPSGFTALSTKGLNL